MDHCLLAAEHPVPAVGALDAHPGLVRRHRRRLPQPRQRRVPALGKTALGAAQQVHQPALAQPQPEQVRQSRLQPFVGQSLEGLQVRRHRVQPRPERCRVGPRRAWGDDPGPADRAGHAKAPVLLHHRTNERQVDLLVHADDLGRKIGRQLFAAR